MNAAEKFKVKDRVRLTPEGIRFLGSHRTHGKAKVPYDENLRGIVTGFGKFASQVRIQRDGIKSSDCYMAQFWTTEGA